jgi:hypothetical protein
MVKVIHKNNLEEINMVEGECLKLKECGMIPSGRLQQ